METAIALVAIVLSVAAYAGYRHLWDRQDVDRFIDAIERVEAVLDRMELATFVVAADLSTAQTAVDKVATDLSSAKSVVETVATDLAAAQDRADKITEGQPGEAADAGAQSGAVSETP